MDEGDLDSKPRQNRKRTLALGVAVLLIAVAVGAAFLLSRPNVTQPPGTQPRAPPAPGGVRGVAGDASVTVSWDPVEGAASYNLYAAEAPGVTKENFASKPGGQRLENVASPYILTGLTNDQTYYFRATAMSAVGESDDSAELSLRPQIMIVPPPTRSLYVTGVVELETGEPATGAQVLVRAEDYSAAVTGVLGEDGRFNLGLTPTFPTRVLAKVTYQGVALPPVTGFRWSTEQAGEGAVDVGRVVLPDAATKRLDKVGPNAASADGSVVVEGIPGTMDSVYAKTYVADDQPEIYPGELAEGRTLPINNVVFVWITGVGPSGEHVTAVDPPAHVRLLAPRSQWVDLEDLQPGNGVIDTPIYSMDYESGYWVREANGWLTDAAGSILPESNEAALRDGTFSGEVFAEFLADHFSWWNVDKPPKICAGEYGDAPDPPYPTNASSGGVYHRDMCRAWLGAWVDADFTAQSPNRDIYDDGLYAVNPIKVRVSNWNFSGSLYLNVLADTNDDGDFSDAGEWVVQNLRVSVDKMRSKTITTTGVVTVESWIRLTLTGETLTNYDGHGTFAIGETEDHRFRPIHPVSVYVWGEGNVTSSPPGISCGVNSAGDCYENYPTGQVVTLTATAQPGESFLYWTGSCSGSSPVCTLVMGQGSLGYWVTARFSEPPPPIQYQLTTYVYGNGTVRIDPPGYDCQSEYGCRDYYAPGAVVTLTATARPGETFLGWGGSCQAFGTNPVCTVTMDRSRYVTATFTQAFYSLYVYVSGNGSVTSSPAGIDCRPLQWAGCFSWFPAGTTVTLTATPEGPSLFQTWTADCASAGMNPVCSLVMNDDKRAGAAFTQSTLDIYVYVAGNGTVTSDPPGIDCRQRDLFNSNATPTACRAWFPVGSWVNLTATPDAGESFLGWGAACELNGTSPTCAVVVGEVPYTTYVFASFTQPYYVIDVYLNGAGRVVSLPAGIDCRGNGQDPGNGTGGGRSCSAAFQKNTTVTLTATPDANETFNGWGGACASAGTNATCDLLMDGNKFVYASFTSPPFIYVSPASNNTGQGNVTSNPAGISCHIPWSSNSSLQDCYVSFPRNSTVVLTATPDPGSTFVEWYGDCTGTSPTCTLVMDGNKYVRARFG